MKFAELIDQKHLVGPFWQNRREQANRRFSGLPGKKEERWKYSDLKFLDGWQFRELNGGVLETSLADVYREESLVGGHHLFFLNGQYLPGESSPPNVDGVEIFAGDEIQGIDRVDESEFKNSFFNLSQASATGAIHLRVADGTKLTQPIHVLHVSHTKNPVHMAPHVYISVGASAEVNVIESFLGQGEYLSTPVTQITAAESATITYARRVEDSLQATHIGSVAIYLESRASAGTLCLSTGAQFTRVNFNVFLEGERANCSVDGIYISQQEQFMDYHTSIDHRVGLTQSEQLYKGVLSEKSRAVFNGRVAIAENAQQSDSAQMNKNLLLSRTAEINTKPELAIEADDVSATHGATVGQISDEEVFYLMSRGVSRSEAEKMLGRGFILDVFERFRRKDIGQFLKSKIDDKLSQLFAGGS